MKKWIAGFLTTIFAVGMLNAFAVECNGGECNGGWANGCCTQECGAYLSLEALLWKACRNNMDYALEGNLTAAAPGLIQKGKIHEPSFDWDIGFRAALGYRLDCDRWDIRAEYTHFKTDASGSVTDSNIAANPAFMATRWHPSLNAAGNPLVDLSFEKGSAKFEMTYDVIDIILGASYCPCPSFELHPFGGVRGLFLEQTANITYKGDEFGALEGGFVDWKSDYTAFGLHGGTDWYYHVCGDFSFFGNIAGSLVVGEPDNTVTFHYDDQTAATGDDTILHVSESEHCHMTCGCDFALGLMWERCCGDTVVALTIGYEMHQWNNVPDMRNFTGGQPAGVGFVALSKRDDARLGFHGLFIRTRVDF